MYGKCSLNTDSQKSTWIAKFERWGPRRSKLGLAMRIRIHARTCERASHAHVKHAERVKNE